MLFFALLLLGTSFIQQLTWASTALGMAIYYFKSDWMGEFKRLNALEGFE